MYNSISLLFIFYWWLDYMFQFASVIVTKWWPFLLYCSCICFKLLINKRSVAFETNIMRISSVLHLCACVLACVHACMNAWMHTTTQGKWLHIQQLHKCQFRITSPALRDSIPVLSFPSQFCIHASIRLLVDTARMKNTQVSLMTRTETATYWPLPLSGEFSSPVSTLCADLYSVSVPTPCYCNGM